MGDTFITRLLKLKHNNYVETVLLNILVPEIWIKGGDFTSHTANSYHPLPIFPSTTSRERVRISRVIPAETDFPPDQNSYLMCWNLTPNLSIFIEVRGLKVVFAPPFPI